MLYAKALRSGYYRVFVDGAQVSQHSTERAAEARAFREKINAYETNPGVRIYYDHDYEVEVTINAKDIAMKLTSGGVVTHPDDVPNQFSFADQTNVPLSTQITSAPIVVSGMDSFAQAAISVTNGQYSINGAAFTNQPGICTDGDSIRARHVSSSSNNINVDTVVTINGISDTFTTTTLAGQASGDLISISDLIYEGAFSLPSNFLGDASFAFVDLGMGYGGGNTFFGSGNSGTSAQVMNSVGQFTIPALVQSANKGSLNQAAAVQNFDQLNVGFGENDQMSNMLVVNNTLYCNIYESYDSDQNNPHGAVRVANSNNIAGSSHTGPHAFDVGTHAVKWYSPIPPEWQSALGGSWLAGASSGGSIVQRYPWGPTAFVFNPADIGVVSPIPTTALLDYFWDEPDQGRGLVPVADWYDAGNVYNVVSQPAFGMIVPNTSTYMVIGHHAGFNSGICYKCNGYGGEGPANASDVQARVWLYDVNDLIDVKNGVINPWDPRPYEWGDLPGNPFSDSVTGSGLSIEGGFYNPDDGRVYLGVPYAGGPFDYEPIIVGYSINTPVVTTVTNSSELTTALQAAVGGEIIELAAGTYTLQAGQTFGLPVGIDNVTIRGATGNRNDVIINNGVYGFWASNVTNLTIQDLTIRNQTEHGVIIDGGCDSFIARNLRMQDIGDQFIKANPSTGPIGADDGLVENCFIEYTTLADDYTNGVDVHYGQNWIIRNNTFQNIRSNINVAGPAILMWRASGNTTVTNNQFIDCARDIALGFDPNKPAEPPVNNGALTDHSGGLIDGNTIQRQAGLPNMDVGISIADSPNTVCNNNIVTMNGTYPNAIEMRFPRTTGVTGSGNTVDAAIVTRDGASGTIT